EASARAWDELRGAADGVAESATGQAVTSRMEALTETLAVDPLSLSAPDFDAVDDAIAAAYAAATSGEALRERLSERLAAGRALLEALPALLAEAGAARDLAMTKIADPAGLDLPDPGGIHRPAAAAPRAVAPLSAAGGLRHLAGELTALEALAAADQWPALATRLPAWSARVQATTAAASAVRERGRALLAHRDELRGRLGAYQAKAQAYGLSEDTELARLAELAHSALYTAPCDLTAAGQQVSAYAAAGAAPAARRPPAGRTTGPS